MKTPRILLILALAFGAVACAPTAPVAAPGAVVGSGQFVAKDGQAVLAVYSSDAVTLTLADGRQKVLRQAVSGSGARYVSGDAEWWEHQGQATYSVGGQQVFVGHLK